MNKIIDCNFIRTQSYSYPIKDTLLQEPFDVSSYSNFCDFVNTSFKKIFDTNKEKIPKELCRNIKITVSLEKQIKTELLLNVMNLLSTVTSEHISSNRKFSSKINSDKSFPFMSSRNLDDFIHKIYSVENSFLTDKGKIVSSDFPDGDNYYYEYSIKQKNSLLEESPLSEYVFTHTHSHSNIDNLETSISLDSDYISMPLPEWEKEKMKIFKENKAASAKEEFSKLSSKEKIHGNTSYLYNKEGCYFLAALFHIIYNDINNFIYSPYIRRSENKLSIDTLNFLTNTLYKAYSGKGVQSDILESSLFLINAENIYHPAWNKIIVDSYRDFVKKNIFNHGSFQEFLLFNNSFQTIQNLQKCPLNSVKIFLWDSHFSKCIATDTKNVMEFKWNSFSARMAQDVTDNIQKMTNCFYYLLLKRYDYISEKDIFFSEDHLKPHEHLSEKDLLVWNLNRLPHFSEKDLRNMIEFTLVNKIAETCNNIRALKNHIFTYLNINVASNTSWSILREPNDNSITINSTGDIFLDGVLPYLLFLND